MAFRKLVLTGALALSVSALTPTKASADWLFTPFIGGTWGGNAKITDIEGDDKEEFNRKLTYGGSIAFLGAGVAGFELDFGYSPNFFGTDSGSSFIGDGNVTTVMANLMLAAPKAPVRPYASFGAGLIRTNFEFGAPGNLFDNSSNNLGFNIGAGLMGYFNDNVAIRGDVRFFRRISNDSDDDSIDVSLDSFKFWRGTVGITFRF